MAKFTQWAMIAAWATVLVGPPLAFGMFIIIRRWAPHALPLVAKIAALLLVSVPVFYFLPLRFTSPTANVACIVAAYIAYCFLSACCLLVPKLPWRAAALFVTAIPIAIGYVAGTYLLPFFLMTAAGAVESSWVEETRGDVVCRLSAWRYNRGEFGGYTISLHKPLTWLPVIEGRLIKIDVAHGRYATENKSCSDAFAMYGQLK